MRILPVALAGRRRDDATLVAWASAASAVTHGEPLARVTCALYVLLARPAPAGPGASPAAALATPAGALAGLRGRHATSNRRCDELLAWERRTGGGHVADAFWSAWEAVATTDCYQDAVVRAVRFGNDTDTTAAIAGGLAGIRWGVGGIPPGVARPAARARRSRASSLDRLLAEAGWRTSTTSPLRVDWVPLGEVPASDRAPAARSG